MLFVQARQLDHLLCQLQGCKFCSSCFCNCPSLLLSLPLSLPLPPLPPLSFSLSPSLPLSLSFSLPLSLALSLVCTPGAYFLVKVFRIGGLSTHILTHKHTFESTIISRGSKSLLIFYNYSSTSSLDRVSRSFSLPPIHPV